MKEYTVIDTSGGAITAGSTHTASATIDHAGTSLNYAIAIKGDIADADVAIDVELPGDTETYQTKLKGQSNLTGLDLTDGGEIRSTEDQVELAALRVAESVTITVTNNDGSAGDATVKILQYQGER